MPAYDLNAHVEALARELGVLIIPPWVGSLAEDVVDFPAGAAGFIEFEGETGSPIIWVSEEPTTAKAYLVALHELGHHATGTGGLADIIGEALAWEWATTKSLIPITPRLRAFIERRLDSYRD